MYAGTDIIQRTLHNKTTCNHSNLFSLSLWHYEDAYFKFSKSTHNLYYYPTAANTVQIAVQTYNDIVQ